MPYNKLDDVRRSLNDKLRKDTRYDKSTRDRICLLYTSPSPRD